MTDPVAPVPVSSNRPIMERVLWGILLCLLAVAYGWTAHRMYIRWVAENSYYTHGFLIPIVSIALLGWRWDAVKKAAAERAPSRLGLLLLVPSLMVHILATSWQVGFLSGFSMLGVLYGLILLLFGRPMLRVTFFPILFLAFMIPLPDELIEKLSFNLKIMSAGVATKIVELLGVVAIRSGSVLQIETGTLVVDDVCSGLKYLISLTAFAALYAHISRVKPWGKWVLFLLSMPIAFIANAIRVVIMVLVGQYVSIEATQSWYFHDLFGFLLFIFAFVTLFIVESLMLGEYALFRKKSDSSDTEPKEPDHEPPVQTSVRLRLPVIATLIMIVAAVLSVYFAWPRGTAASGYVKDFPLEIGSWVGQDFKMDPRVYQILGTEDVLSRRYRNLQGEVVDLVIVVAQQARRRTHPPENCIIGEGYRIAANEEHTAEVSLENGARTLKVRELVVDRDSRSGVTWYFFKSGETFNTNYWVHQIGVALRKVRNPDAADVLIRLDASSKGDDLDATRVLMQRFLNDAADPLFQKLP